MEAIAALLPIRTDRLVVCRNVFLIGLVIHHPSTVFEWLRVRHLACAVRSRNVPRVQRYSNRDELPFRG